MELDLMTTTASEDFKTNIMNGNRYVDKTNILISLLRKEHETTFILRPRRFGKTLTLSMIRRFVEDTRDEQQNRENRELFEGLKIMEAGEKYTSQMTRYPVIHLTLQTVKDSNYRVAYRDLWDVIGDAYNEKAYLLQSNALTDEDKRFFTRVYAGEDDRGRKATLTDYKRSLKKLSEFLRKDSGKKAVVLIDEYDVPLENAYRYGYYEKMVKVVGPMLQNVLKTNSENLQFAVITGCLRIAKEGIYTGLNNPEVNTVLSYGRNDFIGFTEEEVQKLLLDSGVGDHYDEIRDWYDGYRFGDSVIYNPWSVIKHIEALNKTASAVPLTYWAYTSENAIIRDLAEHADTRIRNSVERVMQGEEISFLYLENIVYNELYDKPENVLNVLLASGYLTYTRFDGETIWARIPNKEVHKIFRDQIHAWFDASLKSFDILTLYSAMEAGDTKQMEIIITDEFLSAMSYFDSVEAFYHGVLYTLVQLHKGFDCISNRESGDGRFDIVIKRKNAWDLAFIFEVKISEKIGDMLADAKKGVQQIDRKKYFMDLRREGFETIMSYGISFCQKRCRIVQGKTYHCKEELMD